jgi:hypothetical protein
MQGKKPKTFADHSKGEFMQCHHALQLNLVTTGAYEKGEAIAAELAKKKEDEIESPKE